MWQKPSKGGHIKYSVEQTLDFSESLMAAVKAHPEILVFELKFVAATNNFD